MNRPIARWRGLFATLVWISFSAVGCSQPDPHVDKAIEVARAVLGAEDIQVYDRLLAAGALGLEGVAEGDAAIAEALGSPSRLARRAAMSNVLSTGDTRVFEIAKKAEIDEFDFDLLEVLRTTPTRDATEFLRGKLLDSGRQGLIQALDAVAMGRHRELLPEAEALIGTGDRRFRQFAVFASASLGSTEAMEAAVPALRSRRSGEREASAAAVGFGKSEEMRNALLALRDDPEPGVQIAAWASLSRYGHPQARTKLTEAILSGDDRRAPLAAGALKRGQSETVVAVAREVVDSGKVHPLVLGRVIEAVGWSRNIPAKDVLEMGLAPEQDQHVRLQSLWAVGWRGRAEEKQLAVDHFEDPELPLRAMASWAYLYAKRGGAPPDTGLVAD